MKTKATKINTAGARNRPLTTTLESPIRQAPRLRLLGLASLLAVQLCGHAFAADEARPNFLFVLTDDQRFDAMGVVQREQGDKGRFPWFKSPSMDRLANEGVRFRNAFVTNSLCSPSRAAFLTGRYNHLNGIVDNHTAFPTDSVTWASLLRTAGYRTGYIGKWHMGKQSGQRPGFDFSASFIGQGKYNNQAFEVNGVSQKTKGWIDTVSTDFAIDFMSKNRGGPFALMVGFKAPHGPCQPPAKWKKAYAGEYCRPAVNEAFHPPYDMSDAKEVPYVMGQIDKRLSRFQCINGADDELGRLLDALDELGLAENTMVVFASDNGYYLGDHGLHDKRTAYDESMRIPLLVRFPKVATQGMLVDKPVLNIDLAPTILDYAGVKVPSGIQGQSWRPLLEQKNSENWRKSFFYEYFQEGGTVIPTVLAVRTDTAKLVEYPGHEDWTQLFDLKADPYETKNLADNPERLQAMKTEFARQSKAVNFSMPAKADKPNAAKKKRRPAAVKE